MHQEAHTTQYLTAAFYKFVPLPDYAALKAPLLAFCLSRKVKGMVLLAEEGINSTIAGAPDDVHAVLGYLRADPRLADLTHKEAYADKPPFYRMKVRLKKEIVTMGVPGISPTHMAGTYVKPEDWNALISQPDVVVVDTRNDYEVKLGTFENALPAGVDHFREDVVGGIERDLHRLHRRGRDRCRKARAIERARRRVELDVPQRGPVDDADHRHLVVTRPAGLARPLVER